MAAARGGLAPGAAASGEPLVARIELLTALCLGPAEVYSPPLLLANGDKRSRVVSLVGVARIHYIPAVEAEEAEDEEDEEEQLQHHFGDDTDSRGAREPDHSADEPEGPTAALPEEVAKALAKVRCRANHMRRAAAHWHSIYAPTAAALEEALHVTRTPSAKATGAKARVHRSVHAVRSSVGSSVGEAAATGYPREIQVNFAHGAGHPILRHIQRIALSSRLPPPLVRAAALAVRDCSRLCRNSEGATAIALCADVVRAATAAVFAPSAGLGGGSQEVSREETPAESRKVELHDPPELLPTPSDLSSGDLTRDEDRGASPPASPAPVGLEQLQEEQQQPRADFVSGLQPAMLAMLDMSCATRAESPEIHLHFLGTGVALSRVREACSPRARPLASGPSRSSLISASGDVGTAASPRHRSPSLDAMRSSDLESSQPLIERSGPSPIPAAMEVDCSGTEAAAVARSAARRLQFWDGYFAFRDLGSVSRQLAASQLTHLGDEGEEDRMSPRHKMLDELAAKLAGSQQLPAPPQASPFAPPTLPRHLAPLSTPPLPPDASDGMEGHLSAFPALGDRRRKPHLLKLRRPPGSISMEPLPPQRRRGRGSDSADAEVQKQPHTARATRFAGARGEGQQEPQQQLPHTARGFGEKDSIKPSVEGLSLMEPQVADEAAERPLLPMFAGGFAEQPLQSEPSAPFVTNGIGFAQPLSLAMAAKAKQDVEAIHTSPPARRKSMAVQDAAAARLRKDTSWRAEARRSEEQASGETEGVAAAPPRCKYCIHHGIQPDHTLPPETWQLKAHQRYLHQRATEASGSHVVHHPKVLCAACGGDLEVPFEPRCPQIGDDEDGEFFNTGSTLTVQALVSISRRPGRPLASRFKRYAAVASRFQRLKRTTLAANASHPVLPTVPPDPVDADGAASTGAEALPEDSAVADADAAVAAATGMSQCGTAGAMAMRGSTTAKTVGSPGGALHSTGKVYFIACEQHRARPLAGAAAAIAESGALQELSEPGEMPSPQPGLQARGSGVVISMRGAGLDDRGLAAFIASLTQRGADFGGGGIHVDFAGNRLTDTGVHSLLSSLEHPLDWARRLESLDLAGNRLLTQAALEPLSSLLAGEQVPRLRCLRLGGIELGDQFARRLFKGIDAAASSNLEELDISYLGLGRGGPSGPLAAAELVRQCQALRILDASGNHLQLEALRAMGRALAEGGSARTVHLAHNTGSYVVLPDVAPARYDEYARAGRASSLSNASGNSPKKASGSVTEANPPCQPVQGTAMSAFCEFIPRIQNLRFLDLRDAQVDPRCAFMLACSLSTHKTMEIALLTGNPLGHYGIRCLLSIAFLAEPPPRLPVHTTSRLGVLGVDECVEESMLSLDQPPLSPADPSGSYVLDLRDPWSAAVGRYCLRRWEDVRAELPFEQAFPSFELDGRSLKELPGASATGSGAPGSRGGGSASSSWALPDSGVLAFTLLLRKLGPLDVEFPENANGARSFRCRPQDRHRKPLSPALEHKALSIAAACRSPSSLIAVAHALAVDFQLSGATVRTLCTWLGGTGVSSEGAKQSVAEMLIDSMGHTEDDPKLLDFAVLPRAPPQAQREMRSSLDFVVAANPTGRYIFNLSWPAERLAAEELLLVNAWQVQLAKVQAVPDLSQNGNYQCLRNEALNGKQFVYRQDWVLPTSGFFEFDMAVPRRPSKSATVLSEDVQQRLCAALVEDGSPAAIQVFCLRRVSPRLCLTCAQALSILAAVASARGIRAPGTRASSKGRASAAAAAMPPLVEELLLSVLFFRIKDHHNAWQTFFAPRGLFGNLDRLRACERSLGLLNVTDPLHIHNREFRLSLELHEDRVLCRMVLAIAYSEGGRGFDPKNFSGCAHGANDSQLRPLPGGTPLEAWAKVAPPRRGRLHFTYSGEVEVNARLRRLKAQQVCGWAAA